jgi:hypothetical protein
LGTGPAAGGGFKKGGFKSSFTTVKGPVAPAPPTKKNVLCDEDEDETSVATETSQRAQSQPTKDPSDYAESDTDEEYIIDTVGGGYYDPLQPTSCSSSCAEIRHRLVGATAVQG